MRVLSKPSLKAFWEKHEDSEQALLSWYQTARKASWQSYSDVQKEFGTLKVLGSDRIIFKIKGNTYRLVVKVSFVHQIIWVRFIGTHADYDKIDAKTI